MKIAPVYLAVVLTGCVSIPESEEVDIAAPTVTCVLVWGDCYKLQEAQADKMENIVHRRGTYASPIPPKSTLRD